MSVCEHGYARGYVRAHTCSGYVHTRAHTGMVMCGYVHVWLWVLTRVWLCPRVCLCLYVCIHWLCLLCYVCYVMLCYVMLCYVMSVMYTSPRRNHSVHEYKYFVKPLPSAA